MATYAYFNKQSADILVAGLTFAAKETKKFSSAQPELDKLVPSKFDRYINDVLDNNPLDDGQAPIPLTGNKTLTQDDDGKTYEATGAVTITVPEGLQIRPQVLIIPAAASPVTVSVAGAATINGGTSNISRTRTNNPAGFVITPYVAANAYAVSGS